MASTMQEARSNEVMEMARRELEREAKMIQEKLGGSEHASVLVQQVALPSELGPKTKEHIEHLESENERLKRAWSRCEEALALANKETATANEHLREMKATNERLEERVSKFEREVPAAGAKATELELQLKKAQEGHSALEEKTRTLQLKVREESETRQHAEQEMMRMQSTLQERTSQLRELTQQLHEKITQTNEFSEKEETFRSRSVSAEQQASTLSSRVKELESSLTDEREKSSSLQMEVTNLHNRLRADAGHHRALAQKIDELEKRITLFEKEREAFQREVHTSTKKVEKEVRQEKELDNENERAAISAQLKNLEEEKSGIWSSLNRTIFEERQKSSTLEKEVAALRRRIQSLVENRRKATTEARDHAKKVESLLSEEKERAHSLQIEVTNLQGRLKVEIEHHRALAQMVDHLEKQVRVTHKEKEAGQSRFEAKRKFVSQQVKEKEDENASTWSKMNASLVEERKKSSSLESENAKLQRKVESIASTKEKELTEFRERVKEFEALLSEEKEKSGALQTEVHTLHSRLTTETKQHRILSERIDELEKQIQVTRDQKEAQKAQMAIKITHEQELVREKSHISVQVREEKSGLWSKMNQALTNEKEKSSNLEKELSKLRRTIESITVSKQMEVREAHERFEREMTNIQSLLRERSSQLKDLNHQLSEKATTIHELFDQVENFRSTSARLEHQVSVLTDRVSESDSHIRSLDSLLSEERDKLASSRTEVRNLRSRLKQEDEHHKVLADKIDELEKSLKMAQRGFKSEKKEMVRRAQHEEELVKERTSISEQVEREKSGLWSRMNQALTEEREKVSLLENQVSQLRRKVESIEISKQKELTRLHPILHEHEHTKRELPRIKSLLQERTSQIKKLNAQLSEKTTRIDELSEKEENFRSRAISAERRVAILTSRVRDVESSLSEEKESAHCLQIEVTSLHDRLRADAEHRRRLAQKVKELESRISAFLKDRESFRSKFHGKAEELELERMATSEQMKKIDEDKSGLWSQMNQTISEKRQKSSTLEKEVATLRGRIETIVETKRKESAEAREHIRRLESLLSGERERAASLQTEVSNLQNKLRAELEHQRALAQRVDHLEKAEEITHTQKRIESEGEPKKSTGRQQVGRKEEEKAETWSQMSSSLVEERKKSSSLEIDNAALRRKVESIMASKEKEMAEYRERVEDLESLLSEERERSGALQSEVHSLHGQFSTEVEQHRILAERIDELERQIQVAEEGRGREFETRKKLVGSRKMHDGDLTRERTAIAEQPKESGLWSEMTQALVTERERSSHLELEVSKLRRAMESLNIRKQREVREVHELFELEMARIQSLLRERNSQLKDLHHQLSEKTTQIDFFSEKMEAFRSHSASAEQRVSVLTHRVQELESLLSEEREKSASSETEVTNLRSRVKKEAEHQQELAGRIDELEKRVRITHEEKDAPHESPVRLKAETKGTDEERTGLYANMNRIISEEREKSAFLEKEVSKLRRKLESAVGEHHHLVERMEELERELQEAFVGREGLQQETTNLEGKVEGEKKKAETMVERREESMRTKADTAEGGTHELHETEREVEQKQKELRIRGSKLGDLSRHLKQLKLERQEMVQKTEQIEQRAGELEKLVEKERERAGSLETELGNVRTRFESDTNHRITLARRIQEMEQAVRETYEQMRASEEKRVAGASEADKGGVWSYFKGVMGGPSESSTQEAGVENSKVDVQSMASRLHLLAGKTKSIRQEIVRHVQRASSMETSLGEVQTRNRELKERIGELGSVNGKLEARMQKLAWVVEAHAKEVTERWRESREKAEQAEKLSRDVKTNLLKMEEIERGFVEASQSLGVET